jgi:hypothetical protein
MNDRPVHHARVSQLLYIGADIQTTMIYAHHVPPHEGADNLTRLPGAPSRDPARRTVGARFENDKDPEEAESSALQEEDDAGGGTRTPDTRIMIPLL